MNVEECVKSFMTEAKQLDNSSIETTKDLRIALIEEEFNEVIEAINWGDPTQIAKELADLVYVVVGTSLAFGYPFNETFGAVCESNLSKFDAEGHAIIRSDGKVLKGPHYVAPEPVIKEILIAEGIKV